MLVPIKVEILLMGYYLGREVVPGSGIYYVKPSMVPRLEKYQEVSRRLREFEAMSGMIGVGDSEKLGYSVIKKFRKFDQYVKLKFTYVYDMNKKHLWIIVSDLGTLVDDDTIYKILYGKYGV